MGDNLLSWQFWILCCPAHGTSDSTDLCRCQSYFVCLFVVLIFVCLCTDFHSWFFALFCLVYALKQCWARSQGLCVCCANACFYGFRVCLLFCNSMNNVHMLLGIILKAHFLSVTYFNELMHKFCKHTCSYSHTDTHINHEQVRKRQVSCSLSYKCKDEV